MKKLSLILLLMLVMSSVLYSQEVMEDTSLVMETPAYLAAEENDSSKVNLVISLSRGFVDYEKVTIYLSNNECDNKVLYSDEIIRRTINDTNQIICKIPREEYNWIKIDCPYRGVSIERALRVKYSKRVLFDVSLDLKNKFHVRVSDDTSYKVYPLNASGKADNIALTIVLNDGFANGEKVAIYLTNSRSEEKVLYSDNIEREDFIGLNVFYFEVPRLDINTIRIDCPERGVSFEQAIQVVNGFSVLLELDVSLDNQITSIYTDDIDHMRYD